ncbi:MAG: AhpC/TSA family protein [Chitinophagaceae bacterium]|nr:AhpC/TSA family protein [Chitinophagaceae bacterium]
MKINNLFFLIFFSVIVLKSSAQFRFVDSCVQFTVNLKINNPYSDTISYLYFDCEKNQGYRERVILQNGMFKLSGTVNRAAEIIFICKPSALFDDSSYYRLIVEAGTIEVELTMTDSNIVNDRVAGSPAQLEQRNWQNQNRILLQFDEKNLRAYSNFLRNDVQHNTVEGEKVKQNFESRLNLLREVRAAVALDFIKLNPDSYFSSNILSRYARLYSPDTVMYYFHSLTLRVQQSAFGNRILNDVFARSDNWQLFSNYLDSTTYKKVKNIRSLYDISLPSLKGDTVSLSKYKGKIILIDFWASWCGPCVKSIPVVNRLMDEVKDLPIVILPVSVDVNEQNWRNAVKSNKYGGTQLLDRQSLLATYYKVLGYPTYVIIDQNGKLVDGNAAKPNDGETLKKRLLELVNNKRDK